MPHIGVYTDAKKVFDIILDVGQNGINVHVRSGKGEYLGSLSNWAGQAAPTNFRMQDFSGSLFLEDLQSEDGTKLPPTIRLVLQEGWWIFRRSVKLSFHCLKGIWAMEMDAHKLKVRVSK